MAAQDLAACHVCPGSGAASSESDCAGHLTDGDTEAPRRTAPLGHGLLTRWLCRITQAFMPKVPGQWRREMAPLTTLPSTTALVCVPDFGLRPRQPGWALLVPSCLGGWRGPWGQHGIHSSGFVAGERSPQVSLGRGERESTNQTATHGNLSLRQMRNRFRVASGTNNFSGKQLCLPSTAAFPLTRGRGRLRPPGPGLCPQALSGG